MARITVEDCTDKVKSPYELVLVAKERATQLNSGIEPTLDRDNDKNTVIALREIAEESIKVSDLTESAVYKLRKNVEQINEASEDDEGRGGRIRRHPFHRPQGQVAAFDHGRERTGRRRTRRRSDVRRFVDRGLEGHQ